MNLLTTKNLLVALILGGVGFNPVARAALDITAFNSPLTENFDTTLASSGSTGTSLPAWWYFVETGSNANSDYGVGTGSSTTGNTYSFGSVSSPDRAFGGLRSGTVIPTFGVQIQNKTGTTIESLLISYIGEQWRLGTAGRQDKLMFEYSTTATSLTSGTWIGASALDFTAPVTTVTGAKDGNINANRTSISSLLTLSLANNGYLWLRWMDVDVTGADDGLAIDDFSLTAPAALAVVPEPSTFLASLLLGLPLGVRGIRYLQNRR